MIIALTVENPCRGRENIGRVKDLQKEKMLRWGLREMFFRRATKGEAVTQRFVLGWVRSRPRGLKKVHDVSGRDMFRLEEVKTNGLNHETA